MRSRARIPLLLITWAALIAAGCGSSNGADRQNSGDGTAQTTTATRTMTAPAEVACGAVPGAVGAAPFDRSATERLVARAAARSTRLGNRFELEARIEVRTGLSATAFVHGYRTPDGDSEASLHWGGAAGLLLPDATARIVDNNVYLRMNEGPWSNEGSASGIALDVGHELLLHPFLLEVAGRANRSDTATIVHDVPAAGLRAYASTERQGIATDLLVGARSLTLVTRIADGTVTGDRFTLVTAVPDRFRRIARGSVVTVSASTGYCAPAAAARRSITAPATPH